LIRYASAATFSLCDIEMTARNRISREVLQADMTLSGGLTMGIIFRAMHNALTRSLQSAAQNATTCTKTSFNVQRHDRLGRDANMLPRAR
jgi:hypothetical protein